MYEIDSFSFSNRMIKCTSISFNELTYTFNLGCAKKPSDSHHPNPIYVGPLIEAGRVVVLERLVSSHALCACNKTFFFLVVLFCRKKLFFIYLFYIYNFYFENLIYK